MGVGDVRRIVPHEAYCSPCELAIGVLPYIGADLYHSAFEPAFPEKGEFDDAVAGVVVHFAGEPEVFVAFVAPVDYAFVVLFGALVLQLVGEGFGELLRLVEPGLFLLGLVPVLEYGAVHIELVAGAGDGQQLAVAVVDVAPDGVDFSDLVVWREGFDYGLVGSEEELDIDYPSNEHDGHQEHEDIEHIENHPYAVPFFRLVCLACFHCLRSN